MHAFKQAWQWGKFSGGHRFARRARELHRLCHLGCGLSGQLHKAADGVDLGAGLLGVLLKLLQDVGDQERICYEYRVSMLSVARIHSTAQAAPGPGGNSSAFITHIMQGSYLCSERTQYYSLPARFMSIAMNLWICPSLSNVFGFVGEAHEVGSSKTMVLTPLAWAISRIAFFAS